MFIVFSFVIFQYLCYNKLSVFSQRSDSYYVLFYCKPEFPFRKGTGNLEPIKDKTGTKTNPLPRLSDRAYRPCGGTGGGDLSPRFKDPEAKILVALGGRRNVNEVVNGLSLSHSVSLAYIPCGSGNDFARGMKLAKTPEKLLNRLLDGGECRYIDYGILTYMKGHPSHRRFVVSAGIGFDADVCRNMFTTKLKGTLNRLHIGKLAYLLIGIKRIVLCKSADGVLTLDGIKKMRLHRIRFISFHNQKFEGGGFRFAPAAIPDDGYLNLCIVSGVSRLGLTKILLASLSGKHTLCNGVRSYTCKERSSRSISRWRSTQTESPVFRRPKSLSVVKGKGFA